MTPGEEGTCCVEECSYGKGVACRLKIKYNQICFHVTLLPHVSGGQTIEGKLLQKLDDAQNLGNGDEDDVLEKIADVVCEAGILQFEQLAPPNPGERLTTDLYSLLHPDTFYFQLVTIDGMAQLVREHRQDVQAQLFPLDTASLALPIIAMSDIRVLQQLRGPRIMKVLVKGQERCCKISSNLTQFAVQREFDCLSQVMAASIETLFRVPKLVGLVQISDDDHNSQIVGIIEEFIHSTPDHTTLRSIDRQSVAKSRKENWAQQVRQTVEDLHRIGVVWGDGKADNVLLDVNDNAWLIDFGGGWTNGWVDKDLAGTLDGDNQAVKNVEIFLGVAD